MALEVGRTPVEVEQVSRGRFRDDLGAKTGGTGVFKCRPASSTLCSEADVPKPGRQGTVLLRNLLRVYSWAHFVTWYLSIFNVSHL